MLSMVTFNIRYPAREDGINYFPFRLPLILETIRQEAPDLMAFQEMTDLALNALEPMLTEYQFVGVSRNRDLTGECCCVAFRRDRFSLFRLDHFWLSPTPHVPGSRYADQSDCPRLCTECVLWDREKSQFLAILNTHLDHVSVFAQERGLQLILDRAEQLLKERSMPLFITGDFNFQPQSPAYQTIRASGWKDLTKKIPGSYHGYGQKKDCKIDYILTNQTDGAFSVKPWQLCRDGVYLSDHDPICAVWDQE